MGKARSIVAAADEEQSQQFSEANSPNKKVGRPRAATLIKKRSVKQVPRNDRDNSDIFDVPKFYMPVQLAEREEMVEFEEEEEDA